MVAAQVKYFSNDRGLGYLSHHMHAEDIFFKKEDHCRIVVRSQNPEPIQLIKDNITQFPKVGDWLIIKIKLTDNGPNTIRWGYPHDQLELKQLISLEMFLANRFFRSSVSLFRLRCMYSPNSTVPQTLWAGRKAELAEMPSEDELYYYEDWWIEEKRLIKIGKKCQ